MACLLVRNPEVHAQGYIVPNGVGLSPGPDEGYLISVVHDPTTGYSTGFELVPIGETGPTTYANTFLFDPIVDVGVRVFLVSSNVPISLPPIVSQKYVELLVPNSYVFPSGVPFYLGFYTGNVTQYPANGIYSDPLFGWAELENVNGSIELLNSALEYQGGGIYVGTLDIIAVPEPSILGLTALGGLVLAWRGWKGRAL